MKRSSPTSRTQRAATISIVLAMHALLSLAVLWTSGHAPVGPAPTRPMSLVNVSEPVKTASVPLPPVRRPVIKVKATLPQPAAEPSNPEVATNAAPGAACDTLSAVRNAINTSSDAVQAIQDSPPHYRSIAGAIVLWNADWSAGAQQANEPLAAVRTAIDAGIASVDPACLDEPVAGPRLIPISFGDHSMYVVIGSGSWSWRQLLGTPDAAAPATKPQDQVPQSPPN
jgi:hypothetical protein